MNAAAVPILSGPVRESRLTLGERRELNRLLNRWGDWVEKHMDFDGYPSINILESYIGSDLGAPGHRILCLDMPTDVYHTHQRVIRLPESEREAVWIAYVPRMKPDGTVWPLRELVRLVNINDDAFHQRLSRAKRRLAGVLPL
jgi:hypothetical protein